MKLLIAKNLKEKYWDILPLTNNFVVLCNHRLLCEQSNWRETTENETTSNTKSSLEKCRKMLFQKNINVPYKVFKEQ